MPKTVAIIQARLGSSRLPGKVLQAINGKSMLDHVVERASRAGRIDQVVIATTDTPQDQAIVEHCRNQKWPVFAGSETDVLDRYYQAAKLHQAGQVVRITSDCPMIDSELIDQVIDSLNQNPNADYACNFHPKRWFPRGLDVECLTFNALQRVHRSADKPEWREHVTLMIYQRPEKFQITGIENRRDDSHHRWTVDTPEDLSLVQAIFEHFGHNQFDWQDVIAAFQSNPEWLAINQHIQQKVA